MHTKTVIGSTKGDTEPRSKCEEDSVTLDDLEQALSAVEIAAVERREQLLPKTTVALALAIVDELKGSARSAAHGSPTKQTCSGSTNIVSSTAELVKLFPTSRCSADIDISRAFVERVERKRFVCASVARLCCAVEASTVTTSVVRRLATRHDIQKRHSIALDFVELGGGHFSWEIEQLADLHLCRVANQKC
eukprot:4287237-Prymnesium_polylepis.1